METKILKGKEGITLGAELIKRGEIVAFPTETVYGLGADATDESATKKIFLAKGRPQDNPLIVHLADVSEIDDVCYDDGRARELLEAFAPGPLTVILKKKDIIPSSVTAGRDTLAVRIPAHGDALSLISASRPLAAPSANTSTRPSPTSASAVYEDMNGKIPLIIDGGEANIGIESTILDLTGKKPVILRPGYVTEEDLKPFFSSVETFSGTVKDAPRAPGMKYRHYAPLCELVISASPCETKKLYKDALKRGLDPVVLALGENISAYAGLKLINMGNNDKEVARNLYSSFRLGERAGNLIIAEELKGSGLGFSVMNRMRKAATSTSKPNGEGK